MHVSPLAVDHAIFRPDGERAPFDARYFLHVSTGELGRKNTPRVVAGHERLLADDADVRLVLRHPTHAGGDGLVVLSEHLSEQTLASWYRGAVALVFPSLYEGFGLPILEAMACGCPVITARTSACAEVAGAAAELVDPRSIDEIEGAMRRLLTDDERRAELIRRGLDRARAFTWSRTAARHLDVLDGVA